MFITSFLIKKNILEKQIFTHKSNKMELKEMSRYELIEKPIKCHFGIVYKVKDLEYNQLRLMKKIQIETNKETNEIITREVDFLKNLKNNCIVEYFDYFRCEKFHYIVTEITNEGFDKIIQYHIKEGKMFNIDNITQWMIQFLKGAI